MLRGIKAGGDGKGTVAEKGSYSGFIGAEVFRLTDLLERFFITFQKTAAIEPPFPHAVNGMLTAAQGFTVTVIEAVMEKLQFFCGDGCAAPQLTDQRRIGNGSAAYHQSFLRGVSGAESRKICGGENIAIVAKGKLGVGKGIVIPLHANIALIEIRLHAGMDNELGHGIAGEKGQKRLKFFRCFFAQPGFDRNRNGAAGKDLIQKDKEQEKEKKRKKTKKK